MQIRPAVATDVPSMSAMLAQLVAAGKRVSPADEAFLLHTYIENAERIECSVALDDEGTLLGFQSLRLARAGNQYDTPVGWGIIGTHVSPLAARRGVGSGLFRVTKAAARNAGLQDIEAFIAASNAEGLAYYEKMEFRTHRRTESAICKRFRMADE